MSTKSNLLRYLLSALWMLNLGFLVAQVKVEARFDSATIKVGDQIKFRFEVEQPNNARVHLPILENNAENAIEILQVFLPDTVKSGNTLKIKQEYLVTSFDSGEYNFPPFKVPFETANEKDTLATSPLRLTVLSLPVDTVTQVIDIKPPMHIPLSFAEIWPYLLGLLILLVIILEVAYHIYRNKNKTPGTAYRILEPAHVIALRELDKLRAEKLWQGNMVKQYYSKLTDIVRAYIENRFNILALEMPTGELLDSFKKVPLDDNNSLLILKNLLTLADLVKFAKHNPLPDENEVCMLHAYQFVNNTKPMFIETKKDDEQGSAEQNEQLGNFSNK